MAKKSILFLGIIAVIIIGGIIGFFWINNPTQNLGINEAESLQTADSLGQGESLVKEPTEGEKSLPSTAEPQDLGISSQELALHNIAEDCWVVYGGKVYDFTNTKMHPNMAKAFYSHCGELIGFEEGAKSRHSGSSSNRVENFGTYIGDLN